MALAGKKVTFEVLTLQNSRWSLHGRFDMQERSMALKEAEKLDKQKGIQSVKVIKETYDPETDSNSEVTVFQSANSGVPTGSGKPKGPSGPSPQKKAAKKETPKAKPSSAKTEAPQAANVQQAGEQKAEEKGSSSSFGLIAKILMIILFSITVGALLAGLGMLVVRNTDVLEGLVNRSSYGTLLFAVFALSFLFTGIILALFWLNKDDWSSGASAPARKEAPPQASEATKRVYSAITAKSTNFELEDDDDDWDEDALEDAWDDADNARAELDKAAEEIKEEFKKEEPEKVKNLRQNLVAFLEEGIEEIKAANVRLDKFNNFGLSLFLAGACDAFGIEEGLRADVRNEVLADLIIMLGFSKNQAQKFARTYDSYLATDSRYLNMFKSGIDTMRARIRTTESESVGLQMKNALNEWNKPKPKDADTGPVTVMFTDMVGSTALNQEKGDKVAQEVVREHNRIVRTQLSIYQGKEIKHTGDGIMASFKISSSAVEAAAEIQKMINAEGNPSGEELLKVRIGLHAGELIIEDNDLFGTTVQLAARICDRADTGEVFVSEVIRGICAGVADLDFFDEGQYELKGFSKPMSLYSIIYDDRAEERRNARHAKEGSEVGGKGKRVSDAEAGEDEADEETTDKSAAPPLEENEQADA